MAYATKEKAQAYHAAYYKRNRAKRLAASKAWYRRNRDGVLHVARIKYALRKAA